MSQVVMFDAQWAMCRFLKPFQRFEHVFQGKSGGMPIAFPGTLDLYAQNKIVGYDPNLLAGVTVPLGSKITIWIPLTVTEGTIENNYEYQLLWRMRTVRDYRTGQADFQTTPIQNYSNYHIPSSQLGQPEQNTPSATDQRYFLPGASHTKAYPQTEPGDGLAGRVKLRAERLIPDLNPSWVQTLTASGQPALWQQGVYVGSSAEAANGGPSWVTYECEAKGDELCILAYKRDTSDPWDFTVGGEGGPGDLSFSNTYGNNNGQNHVSPYTGILVTTGV